MKNNKIYFFGIIALLTLVLVTSGFIIIDDNFVANNNDPKLEKKVKASNSKYIDAEAYLKNLGVATKVDEQLLNEKYGKVTVLPNVKEETILFTFPVVNKTLASLQVFDSKGNVIYSIINIDSDNIKLQLKHFIDSEYFLYKYASNNNTYCGKFSL